MFGPAFLVNPVHEFKALTRSVYLPEGTTWYDFYTGKTFNGGQTIDANAPLIHMPLLLKRVQLFLPAVKNNMFMII